MPMQIFTVWRAEEADGLSDKKVQNALIRAHPDVEWGVYECELIDGELVEHRVAKHRRLSAENHIPFLERLTPAQRKKLDKGMARLGRRLRNRNKFFPRLKRAIRNF